MCYHIFKKFMSIILLHIHICPKTATFINRTQKKRSNIYTSEDWMDLIKNCRKRNPFQVNNMVGKFLSFENLNGVFKEYQSLTRVSAMIFKMRKIKCTRGSSVMEYNNDYSDIYKSVDLNKSGDLDDLLETLRTCNGNKSSFFNTYHQFIIPFTCLYPTTTEEVR